AQTRAGAAGYLAARDELSRARASRAPPGAAHGRRACSGVAHRAVPLPRLPAAGGRAPQVSGDCTGPADRVLPLVERTAPPRAPRPAHRLVARGAAAKHPLHRVPDAVLDLALGARAAPGLPPARANEHGAQSWLAGALCAPDLLHRDVRGPGEKPGHLLPRRQLDAARADQGPRKGRPDQPPESLVETALRLPARPGLSAAALEGRLNDGCAEAHARDRRDRHGSARCDARSRSRVTLARGLRVPLRSRRDARRSHAPGPQARYHDRATATALRSSQQ